MFDHGFYPPKKFAKIATKRCFEQDLTTSKDGIPSPSNSPSSWSHEMPLKQGKFILLHVLLFASLIIFINKVENFPDYHFWLSLFSFLGFVALEIMILLRHKNSV